MCFHRFVPLALAAALAFSGPVGASAAAAAGARPSCADLPRPAQLRGVCLTGLPASGTLRLGARVLRSGDVLTAQQLSRVAFLPSGPDARAVVSWIPVYPGGTAPETETVLSCFGAENEPPVAEDFAVETYRDLPAEGLLKITDPEGAPMTYRMVRAPRRGELILRADGSYLYIPARHKVGTDSFTVTATDPAGLTSREATVTVRVLPSTAVRPYTDTAGTGCRFTAEWLRENGIFEGETISGQPCFSPEEPVSRGQFLVMLMETLRLPPDRSAVPRDCADCPGWLSPYLTAARQSGLLPGSRSGPAPFQPGQPLCTGDALRMTAAAARIALPAWVEVPAALSPSFPAQSAPDRILTRSDAASLLCALRHAADREVGISALFGQ